MVRLSIGMARALPGDMRRSVLVLIVCAVACGRPESDVRPEIEALAAPTRGLKQRTTALFTGVSDHPEQPFASKAEALAWLETMSAYDPVPRQWYAANARLLADPPVELDVEWLSEHAPETGALVQPLGVFRRLAWSAGALDFDDDEWRALGQSITGYVRRTTAGPMHLLGLGVSVALLDLLVDTPELGYGEDSRLNVARLRRDVDALAARSLALHKTQAVESEWREIVLPQMQACEDFRLELVLMLSALEKP